MKSPEELFEEHYKGFTSTSSVDGYKKGFMLGHKVTAEEYQDEVLKIVDACFHMYASLYRAEAKEMAKRMLNT